MYKIILMLCIPISVFSQDKPDSTKTKIDTLPKVMANKFLLDLDKSAFEIFVSEYADSINNAITPNELPNFLKEADFDYYNNDLWFPGNNQVSIRRVIISRVNRCKALSFIININTNIYKRKPRKNNIAFSGSSFYDLAKERLKMLECNK